MPTPRAPAIGNNPLDEGAAQIAERELASPPRVEVQMAVSACRGRELPQPECIAAFAAEAMAGDQRALCVRVVDAPEGANLNARFRGGQSATNVLAFPADAGDLLGDVAVCAPVAMREAAAQGKTVEDHCAHLVVHGVLHLLGMDHDTEADAEVMESVEVAVLARLGIANPYGAMA